MSEFIRWMAALTGGLLGCASVVCAQQTMGAGTDPRDVVGEKMPFATPYGPPISAQRAQNLLQAAVSEASRRGWPLNIAIADSGANLVAFLRMDGAQLASIAVAQHKARTAVKFRRPTKVFEDAIQKQDYKYVLTLDDVIASRGGIPLIEDGKLIGAIGCSGATPAQDEAVCAVAAATINH
ncbi:MAG TPA: heme-binding protein [Burkholderiaceae bacterium]|nr:heme-binding protein [Burkholderiaceae bacterium]